MKANDLSAMSIDPALKTRRRRAAVKNTTVTEKEGTTSHTELLHDHKSVSWSFTTEINLNQSCIHSFMTEKDR